MNEFDKGLIEARQRIKEQLHWEEKEYRIEEYERLLGLIEDLEKISYFSNLEEILKRASNEES